MDDEFVVVALISDTGIGCLSQWDCVHEVPHVALVPLCLTDSSQRVIPLRYDHDSSDSVCNSNSASAAINTFSIKTQLDWLRALKRQWI